MHKIRFPLALCPSPRWGGLQRFPRPLAVFKGPTSNGRKGKRERGGKRERKGEGKRKRKRREVKGREGEGATPSILA